MFSSLCASASQTDLEVPPLATQGVSVSALTNDNNKTNSRQTTHPCLSSEHFSPPSPGHSDAGGDLVHVNVQCDDVADVDGARGSDGV